MGCTLSKSLNPNDNFTDDGERNENGKESEHRNGNGVDNDDDSDTDSVNEFLSNVKEAQTIDCIYNDKKMVSQSPRDSLTGSLSNYVSKKRESMSVTFRKYFSIYK